MLTSPACSLLLGRPPEGRTARWEPGDCHIYLSSETLERKFLVCLKPSLKGLV